MLVRAEAARAKRLANPRENKVEKYLRERIKELRGECLKFTSPGRTGVPDRIVILPGGQLIFVELKRPKKGATDDQKRVHERLRDLRQNVIVIDSRELVDAVFPPPTKA